ncbi:pilin [Candidatus Gracilibacteria bacterium]|nr:pilin [Candidatus Gracilibacteria bacterium]
MKRKNQILSASTIVLISQFQAIFAANNGLLGGLGEGTEATEKIRTGDIHLEDIAPIINSMINIFLSLAGTIAVIFVIIGAYKMLFGSLTQDVTKGRSTIIMALTGFAISLLAWFIVKFIFNNFSG